LSAGLRQELGPSLATIVKPVLRGLTLYRLAGTGETEKIGPDQAFCLLRTTRPRAWPPLEAKPKWPPPKPEGARLARLLDASPAVVYSFEAKGDFSRLSFPFRSPKRARRGGSPKAGSFRRDIGALARLWYAWGTIATLLPLANLYFMVVKPAW